MGSSNENSGYGPVLNPWDRERVPGGSCGGSRRRRGGRHRAVGDRHRHGRLDPPARLALRDRRAEAHLRRRLSRYGMIAFASSLDQCGPLTRDVTDAALLLRRLVGRDPCDSTSLGIPGAIRAAERRATSTGLRFGVPGSWRSEGIEPGVPAGVRATRSAWLEELGGERRGDRAAARAARHRRLLRDRARRRRSANLARYDGVRYGAARRAPSDLLDMYEQTRDDGFGAEVKRRIMLGTYALSSGYYEAYYGTRAEGAHEDRPGLRDRLRAGRLRRHARPRRRSPSSSASAPRTRSRCTCPTTSRCRCRWPASPRSRSRAGSRRACRWASRSPGPAFSETRILDAAHALEQAIGFEGVPGAMTEHDAPTSPSSASRSTCSCARARRCSAAARCRFGEAPNTHTCPVCLGHPGHAAGDQRAGGRTTG